MELVISVIIAFLIVEVYAWLPGLSGWLVDQAARRLRAEDQDRYREEWRACLDGLPNSVVRVVHALSYHVVPGRIRADNIWEALSTIDGALESISIVHHKITKIFQIRELAIGQFVDQLDIVRNIEKENWKDPTKISRAVELGDRLLSINSEKVSRIRANLDSISTFILTLSERVPQIKMYHSVWIFSKPTGPYAKILKKELADLKTVGAILEELNNQVCKDEEIQALFEEIQSVVATIDVSPDALGNPCQ